MKHPDFFPMRSALPCLAAVLLGFAAPLAAHPAGEHLPPVAEGPVTILAPDRIKDAPFLPSPEYNPLYLAYRDFLHKLEDNHITVKVHSLTACDNGILLNTTALPATVRYILKRKVFGDKIAWSESGTPEDPVFILTVPDSGSFRITFPAKDWLLCTENTPPAPADDPVPGKTPSAEKTPAPTVSPAELLKAVPDDAVMAVVWPEPGATPEYPLLGEVRSLSLHIVRNASDPRPVHTRIVMAAKTIESAWKIQKACRDRIAQVYGDAAKLGEIPPELVNAFTVTRRDNEVTIFIALPDDMAKYVFTQFAASLQDEISRFAVPDNFK